MEDRQLLHTPSEVKAAVTGNGRADKAQVTTMVTNSVSTAAKVRAWRGLRDIDLMIIEYQEETKVNRTKNVGRFDPA